MNNIYFVSRLLSATLKNSLYYSKYTIIFLIGILISCSQYPIDELLSAPEQIEIDSRKYILETGLYRDFQPICPLDGRPLWGLIWVVAVDSLSFPSSLNADHVWIINNNDVWDTDLVNREIPYGYEYKMKKRIKGDGPKWGPDIYVAVVVQIIDEEDNAYLLRASDQEIIRLD